MGKMTLKHNYNSISQLMQKRVRENMFTNSEGVKKMFIDGYTCAEWVKWDCEVTRRSRKDFYK